MRYLLLAGLIFYLVMRPRIARILSRQVMRNDAAGMGHFGAPRGRRTHQGLDLLTVAGEPVYSPVTGRYVRSGRPYANDNRYTLAVVHGNGLEWKLMYIQPLADLLPGTPLRAGQLIGHTQDISKKYGGEMRPHVHVEVRRVVGAELLDPARLLSLA